MKYYTIQIQAYLQGELTQYEKILFEQQLEKNQSLKALFQNIINMEQNQSKYIQDYLFNRLNQDEKVAFEQKMLLDENLKKAVESAKVIRAALEREHYLKSTKHLNFVERLKAFETNFYAKKVPSEPIKTSLENLVETAIKYTYDTLNTYFKPNVLLEKWANGLINEYEVKLSLANVKKTRGGVKRNEINENDKKNKLPLPIQLLLPSSEAEIEDVLCLKMELKPSLNFNLVLDVMDNERKFVENARFVVPVKANLEEENNNLPKNNTNVNISINLDETDFGETILTFEKSLKNILKRPGRYYLIVKPENYRTARKYEAIVQTFVFEKSVWQQIKKNRAVVLELREANDKQILHYFNTIKPIAEQLTKPFGASDHDVNIMAWEAMEIILKHCAKPHFEIKIDFKSYMRSIIRNIRIKKYKDSIKKLGKDRAPTQNDGDNQQTWRDLSTQKSADKLAYSVYMKQLLELTEQEINKLGDKCQQIIRLCAHDDRSHEEIAEILGITPENSRKRLYDCRKKVKEAMRQYDRDADNTAAMLQYVLD